MRLLFSIRQYPPAFQSSGKLFSKKAQTRYSLDNLTKSLLKTALQTGGYPERKEKTGQSNHSISPKYLAIRVLEMV